jgi:hypothetical protein
MIRTDGRRTVANRDPRPARFSDRDLRILRALERGNMTAYRWALTGRLEGDPR